MNNFFSKLINSLKLALNKASNTQKIALGIILALIIFSLFFLINYSTAPAKINLFGVAIKDEYLLDKIIQRLDEENISYSLDENNKIYLNNEKTARKARSLLVREELVPANLDPWYLFDMERWTITDFERNINLQRSIKRALEQHIVALDDIDAVNVSLVIPEKTLFEEVRNPVTASIRITPRPNSDIRTNRRKISGLVKLVQYAIEGLLPENIAIVDSQGTLLNDFEEWDSGDRIALAERERKLKLKYESMVKGEIEEALGKVLSKDRFKVVRLDIKLDTSRKKSEYTEYSPIELVPQDPQASYNTREVSDSTVISSQVEKKSYKGTGFSPWGPPGQEGNTPPEYQDMSDVIGEYDTLKETKNVALNEKKSFEEKEPAKIDGISLGVFVDGVWDFVYDDKGNYIIENGMRKRVYKAMGDDEVQKITEVLQSSLNFKPERGDSILVKNISFDRGEEFRKIDSEFLGNQRFGWAIFIFSLGLIFLLIFLFVFFIVSRELERRRRLKEEALARQAHLRRQQELMETKDVDDMVGGIKDIDDLKSNAEVLSKERPEDVAQLIRTWLVKSS